ncbi:hypothetical protein C8J56DRAFT_974572 [Mycena floridula]|nr:hypothetical protein C8J56DRAFT_974572 [Mycena floridula]
MPCLTTLRSGRKNQDCRCRRRIQLKDHRRRWTSIRSSFMLLLIVIIIASTGGVWIHVSISSIFSISVSSIFAISVSTTIFCTSISSIFRFIFIINPTRWAFSYPHWPFL